MTAYKWEHDEHGWWVVEHEGMLRTGPFSTQEKGVEWFSRELDEEIKVDDSATLTI